MCTYNKTTKNQNNKTTTPNKHNFKLFNLPILLNNILVHVPTCMLKGRNMYMYEYTALDIKARLLLGFFESRYTT